MREVSGLFKSLTGAPLINEPVIITLTPGLYNSDATYLRSALRAETDAEGNLKASLVEGGAYVVEAGSEIWGFVLPEGTGPLTWQQVRALSTDETDPRYQTLAEYIETRLDSVGGGAPLDPYQGYPGGVNASIRALIDRKAERSDLNLETDGGISTIDAGLL